MASITRVSSGKKWRVPVKVLLFGWIGLRKSLKKRTDCVAEPVLATVARLYSAEIRDMKLFSAFQCGSKM